MAEASSVPPLYKEDTACGGLAAVCRLREAQTTACTRRSIYGRAFGRGFDSRRLHHMNTTRVSNFFIEIRVVSCLESLAIQGFPFFCVWLMCIGKHQNCEDVFIRRHRYMNTAFRYSYFDMLLQTLAVSCISAFDGDEPHCKNGYTHPRSFESAVQKYIHADRSPLF